MRDELVALPLIVLCVLAISSIYYLGSGTLGSGYNYRLTENNPAGYPYVYDKYGNPMAYFGNFSSYNGESYGWWTFKNVDALDNIPDNVYYMLYDNNTGWFWDRQGYYAYYTPDGESSSTNAIPMSSAEYEEFGNAWLNENAGWNINADFSNSYGVIALAIAVLVIAGIVGFNFLGSGENTVGSKFILTGISLLAIWGVFSVISLLMLAEVPYGLGSIFYFGLTTVYCLGIFMKGTE